MSAHPFNDNDGKVIPFNDLIGEVVGVDQSIVPTGVARVVRSARLANFTLDSSKLKKAHRDFLDDLADTLKRNVRFVCKIVGVASRDKAGDAYNQQKGRQRAGEVHGFLSVVQNIDSARLKIQERGEVRGDFGVQDDQNRAVDITVFEPLNSQVSIRLVDAREVWARLGLPAPKNQDQVAFLIRDLDNKTSAVHFFGEDRPQEMEDVVILEHDFSDLRGEVLVNLSKFVSPVDFAGALVFLFPPAATPGPTKALEANFSNIRIGAFDVSLPVAGVSWPVGLKSTTGHLVRATLGQRPTPTAERFVNQVVNRTVASRR
jgi:hypothetical protein